MKVGCSAREPTLSGRRSAQGCISPGRGSEENEVGRVTVKEGVHVPGEGVCCSSKV